MTPVLDDNLPDAQDRRKIAAAYDHVDGPSESNQWPYRVVETRRLVHR